MTIHRYKKSVRAVLMAAPMLAAAGCISLSGLSDLSVGPVASEGGVEPSPDAPNVDDGAGNAATDAPAEAPDANVIPRSCKELRAAGVIADGYHRIDPDGDGPVPSVDVYCEMYTDGGGWTLVARSVTRGSGPFGWHVGRGLVTNDDAPYAMGDTALAISFTELLLTTRDGDAKALGGAAYKLQIDTDDLTMHESASFTGYAISTISGTCRSDAGPGMLTFSGFTARTSDFFFRNADINDEFGLEPDGFQVFYGDCTNGGNLNRLQGMLFVR